MVNSGGSKLASLMGSSAMRRTLWQGEGQVGHLVLGPTGIERPETNEEAHFLHQVKIPLWKIDALAVK